MALRNVNLRVCDGKGSMKGKINPDSKVKRHQVSLLSSGSFFVLGELVPEISLLEQIHIKWEPKFHKDKNKAFG